MPPGVCTIRRKLPPNKLPNSGSPLMQAAVGQTVVLGTVRAIETRKVTAVVARRQFLSISARASDRTCLRRTQAHGSCTRRSLAAARGETPDRPQPPVAPPRVCGGTRPLGGSTIIDVRGPTCLIVKNACCRRRRRQSGPARPAAGRRRNALARCLSSSCPLRRRVELLVRIFGRALKRRIEFLGPNSLKIWFAPGRFQRRGRGRRSSGLGPEPMSV